MVLLSTFSSNPNPSLRQACSTALDFKQFMQGNVRSKDFSPQTSDDSITFSDDGTVSSSHDRQSSHSIAPKDVSPQSPTSMQWSPTPREKDPPATSTSQLVPPLPIPTSQNFDAEDSANQQPLRAQQRRTMHQNVASRLLSEDIPMDSPRSLDGYINKDDDNDSVLLQEQRTLHDELVSAIYMNNVKAAVATLRKMYTRQSRSFRIPALLSLIMPDTAAMLEDNQVELFHVSVKFSLDCIQWCFGVQRGESVESFKYKMNKNIARWVLKETQRKGLPNPASQYTVGIAVALIKVILVDTTELEFCLDILTSLNVPQPLQYFAPYVSSWMKSPPSSQQQFDMKSLQKFVYEHPDLNSLSPRAPSLVHQGREQSSSSSSSSSNGTSTPYVNSHSSSRSLSWEDKNHGAYGIPDFSLQKRDNQREEWIRDSSGSSQQGAREHMLYHLNEYGETVGKLGGGSNGVKQLDRQNSGHNTSSQPLEAKLLKLLIRSTKGELGARIPALYRDEYGEPLRLRGRKLKDILLETGLVEMVGSDGPGDKLFRIIGNSSGDNSRDMSGVSGQPKESPRMRGTDSYRSQTRSYESSLMSHDGSSDPYGSSRMQRLDRSNSGEHGGSGNSQHRPFVPSLLNDGYPGGLSALLKNREGGSGDSYGSHDYPGSATGVGSVRRHNDDLYGSRLPQQTHQHNGQHYQMQHNQSQRQQPQHQMQHHFHNDADAGIMFNSFTGGTQNDFVCESRPLRDGGDYVKRLYEEHGKMQPSSNFSFDSATSVEPLSVPEGTDSVGSSAMSELNRGSHALVDERAGDRS